MLFFKMLTTLFHPRRAFGLSFLLCLLLTVASPVLAAEYDLVLNQDDSPDPVAAGGIVTYSLRVTNDGDDNAISNIQLTDTLPGGIIFLDSTPSQGSCTAPSGGQFTCALGTLTPHAEATVAVRVRTTVAGPITNSAAVTSTTPGFIDPQTNNNSQDELTTVNAGANLALTKIANPSPAVQSGATLTYTLTVINAGPDAATDVQVVDNLPPGFVRTGSLPGGCSQVGQVVTCDISGSITTGGNQVIGPINGQVTAASPSTLTNAASVTITNSLAPQDPDMSDNTVTVDTTVTTGTDLAITKTQSVANPIIQGNSFNYVLTVTTTGDNPSNISVTDTIPVNFTIGIPSGTGWSCGVAGQDVTCTRPAGIGSGSQTLPAITIPVTAATTGTGIVNTGTVTSTAPGFSDPVPGNNSSSVTTNVLAPNADLRANKSARRADGTALTPLLVEQGVQFRYRISLTNLGPSPVASGSTLTMTDTLPAGITADSYAVTNGWTCTALPLSGPATITCTRPFPTGLAVNATTPVVDIYVVATTTGALINQVCVSGGDPADANPANDCASATVTSQANPTDLQVFKTDTPDPVDAGEPLTYAIEIANISTVTATSVTLTDTFTNLINNSAGPTGAGFIDAVVINNLATGGSCSSAASGSTGRLMTCTFTSIPQCTQGTNCPIVTARVRPRGEGNRTNSAYAVSSTIVDDNIADNTSTTITTLVDPIADVRTTITDTPDPLRVGTDLTYVGTIINQGPSNAANGTINITLPVGVAFLSAAPSAGSCGTTPGAGTITTPGNQTVSCDLGTIALLGGQQTVTILVRPTLAVGGPFPVTITAQSSVDTTTDESDETNNTASTTTVVTNPSHDLLINKTDSPDPVAVGDNVTYTVRATNNGPSYATAVQVVDTLPSTRLSFVSATPSAGSCSPPVGNVLTCDLGDIPTGANRTISVVMTGILKGVDVNSASVSSAETRTDPTFDPLPSNNSVSEDTTVRSKVDLEVVSKVPVPDPVELRQPFSWTISIRNNTGVGLAEADNVVLSDTLPSGMVLTGTPSVTVTSGTFTSTTCTGSAGQTSFSCTLGTVSSGATGTVTVPVRVTTYPAAVPHTLTNCASLATISIDINGANNTGCGSVTVQKSSLAGYVYRDLDDDGAMDGGETGINGVTLTLTGTDAYGNAVNQTTTTNASGAYLFDNLSPSDGTGYTVTETQPPLSYFDGLDSRDNGASAIPGSRTTDVISSINVPANTALIGYLFGEIPAASISGYVWNDEDNDGVRDAGETTGIPNAQITLTGSDYLGNPVNVSTTTNASGAYSFGPLRSSNPSGYTVTETQPAGWADGLDSAGTAGGTAGNDIISNIVLNATTVATGYNFGERGGSLAGTVYNDLDDNGIRAPAEPGIPNVTVTLTGTDVNGNPINRVTTTASNGSYSFTDLPMPNATGYTITETQPAGWNDGKDAVGTLGGTLGNDVFSEIHFPTPGAAGTGYNFGEIQGTAGIAQVSGKVWLDSNHDRNDNDANGQAGWTVELIQRTNPLDNTNYTLIATTITNAAGDYAINGLSPGTYEIRFRHPSSGYIFGIPISAWPGVDLTYGTIRNLALIAGDNVLHQDLPLDPGGVVYDAVTRIPVAGAVVTLSGPAGFNPDLHLVGGAANVSQTTDATGVYQFQLFDTAPDGVYTLTVTAPTGYLPIISAIIPPCSGTLDVLAAPAPALVQNNAGPPTTSTPGVCPATSAGLVAGADTTQYFLAFNLQPGTSANVVNNHIPLDPAGEALLIAKTVNKRTASVGDLILYTLRIHNTTSAVLSNITIRDNIPAGFKYVQGSAQLDGQAITPVGSRPIEFPGINFAANQTHIITYVLVVGSGVQEGEYVNTAFALMAGNRISNIARASVCVVKDPIFDLTTIIGKVFHDKNGNGVQDEGEEGIALAKVVSVRGEIITTDQFGRYHIAAVDAGRSDRGRNYILKVDPKSLPAGATFTTDNPRVIRITPGLMQKMNFGVKLPADASKPGKTAEPSHEAGGGSPAGTSGTAGTTTAPSSGVSTPVSGGKAAPEGTAPSISVTQDRLLAIPKLNLSIANDIIIRTDKSLQDDIIFFIYTNYPDFIEGYKIIVYEKADLEGKYPLKTIELKKANNYEPIYWNGILDSGDLLETNKEYKYLLEAYGKKKRRDVTLPKFFTVTSGPLIPDKKKKEGKSEAAKGFPGFGLDNTAQRSIIPEGEKVVIYGKDLSPTDKVYIDEQPVAVDEDGRFIAESYKSPGGHQSTIVVKDAQGTVKSSQVERIDVAGGKKGSLKAFFKDFFQDFFIVGIIDLTLGQYSFRGNVEPVAQDDHYDEKVYVDGRAAFYLKGKIKGKYLLTAYLDSEEGKLQDIYKRLGDKDPKRVFRNLDPDKYYPVYGDDSTLVSDVETQGRFYVKIEWDKSKVLWGNYNTQITGTELARYNRSLYGGKVYYESVSQTKFGDSKGILTGFISEAQTLQDHNEFLSTGGSLYYLKNQHVVEGSDKVSIQIRDKDSGRVINTATLIAGKDYTIDYYQGRILLNSPLPMIANSNTVISSALLNGDAVSLVVDYEYNSDCFGCNNGVENLTGGARGFWWVFDQFGMGATFVREKRDDQDYNLYGVDAKIKLFKGTYTNIEFASSQQTQIPGVFSVDGGLSFSPIKTAADRDRGNAYKIGQVVDFKEITGGDFPLYLEAYYVFREEGFSSLDKDTGHDTSEYGVNLQYDILKNGIFRLKHATFDEKNAFLERTSTAQLEWRWTDRLRTILEVRYKKLKEGEGNIQVVHPEDDHVLSDEEDVIGGVKVTYDLTKGTQLYADQQVTLYRNDETPRNNKTTLGISTQIAEWLKADLEGFVGDLGYGGRVGLTTTVNERLNTYTSYMLSTDRTEGKTHRVTFGSTYRMNDQTDIYSENQFKDSREETANSEIVGIKYRPTQRWNFDFKYENSHVTKDTVDSYIEQNIIKRDVASLGVTYDHGPLKASSRFELRFDRGDEDENQYVTTNSIKYTLNKEWTFLGNLNFSLTRNRTNHINDASFFEINTGFAYRPIKLDKLNMLFKYTYLEDLPPLSQQGSTDVAERSHVVSWDGIYDLSKYFSLAGKAAFKSSQMRLGRTSGEWVSSDTMLFVGRINYQFIKNWDASLEYRYLEVIQAKDRKHGPVVCLYRHIGDHVMIGAGYNFTDFNDDLTNLNYEAGGWFVNFIATW